MSITIKALVFGIFLPALVCITILVIAWRPWQNREKMAIASWGPAVGVAIGYIAGYLGLKYSLQLNVSDGLEWLGYGAALIAFFSQIDGVTGKRVWIQTLIGLSFAIAFSTLLIVREWMTPTWCWRLSFGSFMVVTWGLMETLAQRRHGASMPIILCLTAAVAANIVAIEITTFGQLAGVLAAAIAPCMAISWLRGQASLAHGPVLIFVLILSSLLLHSYFGYTSDTIPLASFVIVLLAPLAAWVGEFPPVLRWRPWQATLMRVSVVAVFLTIAIALGT